VLDITLQQTRVYREIKEEGRVEEAANIVIRQITKRWGQKPSEELTQQITGLPLPVLEDLSEALLDFTSLVDLQAWLDNVS
jgi:predicted transposase YdaD